MKVDDTRNMIAVSFIKLLDVYNEVIICINLERNEVRKSAHQLV